MNKRQLRDLIEQVTSAQRVLKAIEDRNRCGSSGDQLASGPLDVALENILRLMGEPVFSKPAKALVSCLTELEAAKQRSERFGIIHWSGVLMREAGKLVDECLGDEAGLIAQETELESQLRDKS